MATSVETVSLQDSSGTAGASSEVVAGANMGLDAKDLGWGALAGPVQSTQLLGRKGPRTPEGHKTKPRFSTGQGDAQDLLGIERPAGLPPVRHAFDHSVDQSHDLETPLRGKKGKHGHKHAHKNELPRHFVYAPYVISGAVYCMLIFIIFQYGTSFVPATQYAWLIATITSVLFEHVFWQPFALVAAAWLQVRSHLYEVMRPAIPSGPEITNTPPESPIPEIPMTPPPPTPPPPVPNCLGANTLNLVERLIPFYVNESRGQVSLDELTQIAASCQNSYPHPSRLEEREEERSRPIRSRNRP